MADEKTPGDSRIGISATVFVAEPHLVARTVETFARAATGLALEGISVSLSVWADLEEEP